MNAKKETGFKFGTYAGSNPLPPHGRHLMIRLNDFQQPRIGPYLLIASIAY
jgi:hypothetical protein